MQQVLQKSVFPLLLLLPCNLFALNPLIHMNRQYFRFYCALYPDELKELRRLIDFSLTDDAIESALSLENYCLN